MRGDRRDVTRGHRPNQVRGHRPDEMPRTVRRWLRRLRGEDTGLTLVELVVSMSIMSLFMAMFTVATVQMFGSANRNEALATAESQVNNAFLRLDKEVRYASGVSKEGTVGDDQYVEFLTTHDGNRVCTQLRLNKATEQLQRRTWTQGASPLNPTPWLPVASFVGSDKAFTTTVADSTYGSQRLRLKLTAHSGGGTSAATAQLDITFTALNTSLGSASDSVCTEGRSAS